jgi:hypothetical protein
MQEIRKLTKQESWRFFSGELNHADSLSRGSRGVELTKIETWWNGLEFLGAKMNCGQASRILTKSDDVNVLVEMAKPKTFQPQQDL